MLPSRISDKEHTFWRRLVLPQEDRRTTWAGVGYRWFRSPNVICLEHYRAKTEVRHKDAIVRYG
jgi:hypothetical protein